MSMPGVWRTATIALLATAVGGVASPRALHAQGFACEAGDREVRDLEFRGNHAVSDADLGVRVATTPSAFLRRSLHIAVGEKRCLNEQELPRDMARLKEYYRQRGYYQARVDTLVQPLGPAAVKVIFTIDEGRPILLQSYEVNGLAGVPDSADIVNDRQLKVGQPFDNSLLRADMDTIVQRLRNEGYYHADILLDYHTNTDSLFATVSLTALPGRPARFGEPIISIQPVDKRGPQLSPKTVRRVLGIAPGQQYSDQAIVEAQRSLFQLGAYRHVEVVPLPDSLQPPGDSVVMLEVRLTEDYLKRLDSEYGWATLDCGRIRLQYTDLNFARSARRFEATAQASKIGYGKPLQTRATRSLCTLGGRSPLTSDSIFSDTLQYYTGVSFRQPRLLGTRWVPTISLYSERRGEYKAYLRQTNVGADFSALRDIAYRTQLRLGYSLEYGRTTAQDAVFCALFNLCDPASRDVVKKLGTVGVASADVVRVRTDNDVSPTRGNVLRAQLRSSASPLLGTSRSLFFSKASGDASYYLPVSSGTVLALRLRAGAVTGRRLGSGDSVGFVPPQERLYAGGATSVRGYQQNELGGLVYLARATDVDTTMTVSGPDTTYQLQVAPGVSPDRVVPLGGNTLLVANIDYRIRDPFLFPDLLQYALFVDAGDVWNREANRALGANSLKWTPGVGIRALTPVGPIQVNVAWNPYQREAGAIYYDPGFSSTAGAFLPLYCVSPGNKIVLHRDATSGILETVVPPSGVAPSCDGTFRPPTQNSWYRQLTFTFSIGSDF
jgi:outer membrane protein assembly factor BamA